MSKLYSETRACANPANFYRVLNQVMPTEQCQQLFALISERSCRVRDRLVGHPSEFLRICGGTAVCQCLEKAREALQDTSRVSFSCAGCQSKGLSP